MKIENLTVYRGVTWDIDDTIVGPDGQPFNLTDYGVRGFMFRDARGDTPIVTFVGTVKGSSSAGVANLRYTALLSGAVPPAAYVYHVEVFKMIGDEEIVYRATQGTMTVK